MFVETKRDGEAPVKTDPHSLTSLIAWLETQRPEEKYCYFDHGLCLLGKYYRAHGFANIWIGGATAKLSGTEIVLSEAFQDVSSEDPHTFGAALERARVFADK
jgi:hypothetical protein